MTESTRRELLDRAIAEQPSPFCDAVLPNAFRDTPDVPLIHGDARKRLLAMIGRARTEGATALQVVTGSPGEGKTHLLAWLRRGSEQGWGRADETAFALAPIAPPRSPDRPFHHVLQEAVWRLAATLPETRHTDASTDSPIEIVLWRALLRIVRLLVDGRRAEGPLAVELGELLRLRPEKFFATFAAEAGEVWPSIQDAFVNQALRLPELAEADREIMRVVACFPQAALRGDLMEWLGGGGLSPDRLEALGTSLPLDGEPEAWRGLSTLLLLFELARVPLVLAFDQIESTERLGDDAVREFLGALAEIFNAGRPTVMLLFCQTQLWPKLRDLAQGAVRDRLEAQPLLNLKALTPEEGLALVDKRLEHFWQAAGLTPPSPLYPFERSRVIAELSAQRLATPRHVLRHFDALLRDPGAAPAAEPPEPAPREIVRRKLASLLDEQRRAPPRAPEARADIAESMLRQVLASPRMRDAVVREVVVDAVGSKRVGKHRFAGSGVTVRRGREQRRLYVEASNSVHGKSASATVRRLLDALSSKEADRVVLVREAAFPLPAAAASLMAEMTSQGAVVWLRDDEVAPLAALESLLNAAAAGDVPVDKEVALEEALELLPPGLGLAERVLEVAFDDPDPPKVSLDGYTAERVHDYLRTQRAFESLPRLAERLDAPVERVHAAVEDLVSRGLVEMVPDRSRVPVVLLLPEGS